MAQSYAYQTAEWRVVKHLTLSELSGCKVLISTLRECVEKWVRRIGRLDYHLASLVAPTSSARHLKNGLPSALNSTEVGGIGKIVGIEYAYECNALKIKAFGDYLCADKYIGLARGKLRYYTIIGALTLRRIAVKTQHACRWEEGRDLLLDLLCAEAHSLEL